LPVTYRVAPLLALLCLTLPNPAICQSEATRTVTIPEIRRIEVERAQRTDAQKKISSHLLDAFKEQRSGAVVSGVPRLRSQHLEASGGNTLVDIDADVDDALLSSIRQAGGTIVNAHPVDHAIRAYIPLDRIERIAGNSRVNAIAPAEKGTPDAIQFDREGDIGHAADKARELFHIDGSGVKIGILSDSIDNDQHSLENAYQTGAIDRNLLHVIPGQEGTGSGEGLAMAELVHAIAPRASIYFASGDGGEAQMAANIRALQEAGCVIIVDDMSYTLDSPFQDGPISRAVSQVSAKGVLYFASAGNRGNKKHNTSGTWEGDFTDGGIALGDVGGGGAQLHAFAPGTTVNRVLQGGEYVALFWADPLRRSSNQYNLYVVDAEGHVLRSSTSSHTGRQDPYQIVEGLNEGEGVVVTKSAESAPLFIHVDSRGARLGIGTGGSTRGHNASIARNAFAVAAIEAARPPEVFRKGLSTAVEPFSSDGPRRMFFNADGSPMTPGNFSAAGGRVFEKPDVTAADGVTTSLPSGGLNPFHGTSAAAPHAAAVAALVLSYDRTLKPEQVRDILTKTAQPIDGGREHNYTAGAGVVMAFDAVRAACLRTQPFCPVDSDAVAATSNAGAPQSPTGLVREPGGVLREPGGVLREPAGAPQTPPGTLRNPTGLLREP
jgi:subtilisin family serine protease